MIIAGHVILDSSGRPWRSLGGAISVLDGADVAEALARAYSLMKSLINFAPFRAAPCRLEILDPSKAAGPLPVEGQQAGAERNQS